MTINIAWIRKLRDCEELWIVSDSRLSGLGTWDECTKIIVLPGNRSFISFAGSTNIAYPILNQIQSTVTSHRKAVLGYMDIIDQKGHILNVINSTIKNITYPTTMDIKDDLIATEFILGGYSWIKKKFVMWKIAYVKGEDAFRAHKAKAIKKFAECIVAGDVTKEFVRDLNFFLKEKYPDTSSKKNIGFNMEPFEVVRDALIKEKNNKYSSIGGPPQLVKIYQHANAAPVGVFWSNQEDILKEVSKIKVNGSPTISGRYLQPYENTDCIYLDPSTLVAKRISSNNFWNDISWNKKENENIDYFI
ncbi:hypothetical protein [Bacillus thuringiensis]|uniref:hypothetical protein n=1 Tax=Bacillus thuringiensis TaxID=1428 RepID=UPI000BED3F4C|nr:hypothetical protein [Bacillus thuringiensis]PDZ66510.1 hypothetical protein CON29_04545 [Bacillus thuringiensis]